ncbi:hypothetical protein PHMEG_0002966 [Phytophthora megakarya]|uniref:Uncharacterized protein n=1 Tax=Phytophthora megakarya TaxID=4795 RepID=A0A225WXC7_9STRA|nr:hypothetical protein PHMEG_0002966 [Phytophthora megakarya]
MSTSIDDACSLLLYKNMHLPIEEEDQFADTTSAVLLSPQDLLKETQQLNRLLLQQQQQNARQAHPRSPRHHGINAALPVSTTQTTVALPAPSGTVNKLLPNISMNPDSRTQECALHRESFAVVLDVQGERSLHVKVSHVGCAKVDGDERIDSNECCSVTTMKGTGERRRKCRSFFWPKK